jgi:hypothetical protein
MPVSQPPIFFRTGELSGDEQRLLFAFRVVPAPAQAHFLAILEQASLVPRANAQRTLLTPTEQGLNRHALEDLVEELAQILDLMTINSQRLSRPGPGPIPNRRRADTVVDSTPPRSFTFDAAPPGCMRGTHDIVHHQKD